MAPQRAGGDARGRPVALNGIEELSTHVLDRTLAHALDDESCAQILNLAAADA